MQAKFSANDAQITTMPFKVIKQIELSQDDYLNFCEYNYDNYPFIMENKDVSVIDEDGVANCLLVLCEGQDDGVLVLAEGNMYPKQIAHLPGARQYMVLQQYPSLKERVMDLNKLVEHYAAQALESQLDGVASLNYYKIRDSIGKNKFDENLFMRMLEDRTEIESVAFGAGGYEVMIAEEYAVGDEGLLEVDDEDIEISCAKHTLHQLDAGGEQAKFTKCVLRNANLSHKDLSGAGFNYSKFINVNFANTGARGCNFSNSVFYNCNFTGFTADISNFKNVKFFNCKFMDAVMTQSNFTNAKWVNCEVCHTSIAHSCSENMLLDGTSDVGFTDTCGVETSEEVWQNKPLAPILSEQQ